jgi:hypothetical protein
MFHESRSLHSNWPLSIRQKTVTSPCTVNVHLQIHSVQLRSWLHGAWYWETSSYSTSEILPPFTEHESFLWCLQGPMLYKSETTGNITQYTVSHPGMRVQHWAYGHGVTTMLNPRGVTTMLNPRGVTTHSQKYSLTVASHGTLVLAVHSTVQHSVNFKIKTCCLRRNLKMQINSSH